MTIKEHIQLMQAEYRNLTEKEIEIHRRKRELDREINNELDKLAIERAVEPQQEENIVTTIPKSKKDEEAQEFIKQLSRRWKK